MFLLRHFQNVTMELSALSSCSLSGLANLSTKTHFSPSIVRNMQLPVFLVNVKQKGQTHTRSLMASVKLKCVISSVNRCPTPVHFVSLYYLSAGSLPRSLVTHQYHNLITHNPQWKITRRHFNCCDSSARGNVKPFPCLCSVTMHSVLGAGFSIRFLLWPLSHPTRKFQSVALLQR